MMEAYTKTTIEAYIKMWKNCFDFSGRSRRRDYWLACLMCLIVGIVLGLLEFVIPFFRLFTAIYGIAIIIPGISLGVRRLHDTDRTGWWLLITLVPLIGAIMIIVYACNDSTPDNEYGPNPKGVSFNA